MNAQQHLAAAEQLLDKAAEHSGEPWSPKSESYALAALAHATIAVAAELGAPHAAPATTGPADG